MMTPNSLRWTPLMREKYGKHPYRVDDENGFNVLLESYVKVVREVAKAKDVPLIDVYAAYQKMPGSAVDTLLSDGVHPNNKGHALVYDLLSAELARLSSQDVLK